MDAEQMRYIVIWDNVSFPWSAVVQNWFHKRPQFSFQYLPPSADPRLLGALRKTVSGGWWMRMDETHLSVFHSQRALEKQYLFRGSYKLSYFFFK